MLSATFQDGDSHNYVPKSLLLHTNPLRSRCYPHPIGQVLQKQYYSRSAFCCQKSTKRRSKSPLATRCCGHLIQFAPGSPLRAQSKETSQRLRRVAAKLRPDVPTRRAETCRLLHSGAPTTRASSCSPIGAFALGMRYPAELYRPSARQYHRLADLDYPFHDRTITVTQCGRLCMDRRKINLSTVFAGQNVGVRQLSDKIWLVSFMHYDLGFFDDETCRLEPVDTD